MKEIEIITLAQKRIGYTFNNPKLLLTALTHSSYANEHNDCESNEKLEFLGDALLNFISAKRLYDKCESEGEMTVKRSKLVSRIPLGQAVEKMQLMSLVRFGHGANDKDKNELSSKAISDVFEAVLGAIYLDCGNLSICELFIKTHLADVSIVSDFKSELQEYVQSLGLKAEYNTVDVGNVHQHYFRSAVSVNGKIIGEGEGRTKKEAEKNAASKALAIIKGKK